MRVQFAYLIVTADERHTPGLSDYDANTFKNWYRVETVANGVIERGRS